MKTFLSHRYKAALWLLPVLLAGMVAHLIIIPISEKTMGMRNTTSKLQSHKYEKAWLDSVNAALELKIKILNAHLYRLKQRTITPEAVKSASARINKLMIKSGLDISESSPELIEDPDLNIFSVQVRGSADFTRLIRFFRLLRRKHPQFSIESMSIKKSNGSLEYSMTFRMYSLTGAET